MRAAAEDTLIVADGFSCREQISQSGKRRALHLAEVIQLALREGVEPAAGDDGPKTRDGKEQPRGSEPATLQPPEQMVTGAG